MIVAIFRSLGQLSDPAIQRVAGRALLWSFVLFLALLAGAWWGVVSTNFFGTGWLDWAADMLGWVVALIAAIVLFPGAVLIIISFMLEEVAQAVEARHYPDLPPPRAQPVSETVFIGLKFAGIAVALNLLVLPLYFVPVLNIFVFMGLNGYLLGREYYELIAFRRLDRAAARNLWRHYRGRLYAAGVVITAMLSIPFINWFMPVVAATFMVHVFEGLRRKMQETSQDANQG